MHILYYILFETIYEYSSFFHNQNNISTLTSNFYIETNDYEWTLTYHIECNIVHQNIFHSLLYEVWYWLSIENIIEKCCKISTLTCSNSPLCVLLLKILQHIYRRVITFVFTRTLPRIVVLFQLYAVTSHHYLYFKLCYGMYVKRY